MRKIATTVLLTAMMALAAISTACTKAEQVVSPLDSVETYTLDFRFDAEGVNEATLSFYDNDLNQVAVDQVAVPGNPDEVIASVFTSSSRPEWVYTDGLVNGDEDLGMVRLRSVKTKAGDDAVLLVVRK